LQKATVLVNVQRTGHKFSRYCFPSKLYEYMASGKFVISTDISDIREHFKNQIFILKEDNPETLAQTIDYILNNKENLKHIPQKAQKYIIENENWEQQALKVLQFLNSLKILQK